MTKVVERLDPALTAGIACDQMTRTYAGCFPLQFSVRTSGGRHQKECSVDNLRTNDESVYCSEDEPPVYIVFDRDTAATVTEFLVCNPASGYSGYNNTAKDCELMVYNRPSGIGCLHGSPIARLSFEIPKCGGVVKHVFSCPLPQVRSILLLVRTSWGEVGIKKNVDLKYVLFGGYHQAHFFPSFQMY